MFQPKFQISSQTTQALMDIEFSRHVVSVLPVSSQLIATLRESARLTSTHYSTQIEGNRLTQEEVSIVAQGGTFPNRKRDETEVKNYFIALDYLESLIDAPTTKLTVKMIQQIHGCVMGGKIKPSGYRDGQNVIRESGSGRIIYLPPEWKEVPQLMQELVVWINSHLVSNELPVPIIAAIAHYQFATIHPYYDGNGRTARLLTNLILHLSDYGLHGIYSLEEYYARNLQNYYAAISIGESHNYHLGRADSDISSWVEYFCQGMADSFASVRVQAEKLRAKPNQNLLLRELNTRQKNLLEAFRKSRFLTTMEIADHLGVSSRTGLNLCNAWIESGFLIPHGQRRNRRYELGEAWVELL